jgi:hypothetical protein
MQVVGTEQACACRALPQVSHCAYGQSLCLLPVGRSCKYDESVAVLTLLENAPSNWCPGFVFVKVASERADCIGLVRVPKGRLLLQP